MNPQNYTEEQKKDIIERVNKANKVLKDLQLFPSAIVQKVKISDNNEDVFADKVICFLADSKYQPIDSPYTKND